MRSPKTQAAQARALRALRKKTLCDIPLDIADDLIDDAAPLWCDARADRSATIASGIGEPQTGSDFGDEGGRGRKKCLRTGSEKRQFLALGFSGEVKLTRSVVRGSPQP